MKTWLNIFGIVVALAVSVPVIAGESGGHGDSDLEPPVKLKEFPGIRVWTDILDQLHKSYPAYSEDLATALGWCKPYKNSGKGPGDEYALTEIDPNGTCRTNFYIRFYKERPSEEQQAQVTLHEALHWVLRFDSRSQSNNAKIKKYLEDQIGTMSVSLINKDFVEFNQLISDWDVPSWKLRERCDLIQQQMAAEDLLTTIATAENNLSKENYIVLRSNIEEIARVIPKTSCVDTYTSIGRLEIRYKEARINKFVPEHMGWYRTLYCLWHSPGHLGDISCLY